MTAQKATTASKARRRALTVAALAAGAVLALTGCSAGQLAQTSREVAAVNGNSADVGKIALRDVRFLLPQSEEYNNAKGGKAVLAFSAANLAQATPDELVSVTTDFGTAKINGKADIKAQSTLVADFSKTATTTPAAAPAGDKPADPDAHPLLIEVDGLTKDITPGLTYPVTFIFKEGGTVALNVPVDAGPDNPRPEPVSAETKSGH
ncbi:hypothetical protein [Nocardia sp. NBC_01327]|uniref:hypothetical protein n=1 Tax=Nocardia sp. NBC_01327 TaxID=2903593 RepID=UPI002E1361B3|nr:hypothetical protein OG326_04580 [Nocardia sp. NBC_01327]